MNEVGAPTLHSYGMIAALVLIWGTTFLLVKFALREASPELVVAARILCAAAVLVPYAVLTKREWPRSRGQIGGSVAVGLFSTLLPFSLLAWAQQFVPSGVAGVYMAVTPLMILPLAHFFSPGETMTLRKLIGFLIGFGGVLILMGWDSLGAIGQTNSTAQLACFGAACCYAVGSILLRRTPKCDPITLTTLGVLLASIIALPLGWSAWPAGGISAETGLILFTIGAISTAFALVLRVLVITSVGSIFMSSVGYLIPITALTVGVLFAGEIVRLSDALAVALILIGLGIAQNIRLRRST